MRLGIYFLLFCFWICAYGAEKSWQQTAPGGFQVKVEISDTDISLLDDLSLTVTARFPEGYRLDWNALKSHLFLDTGFSDIAFQLVSESISPESSIDGFLEQKGNIILSPLIVGQQTLTFLNISFIPKDLQKPPVEIISDIFDISVNMPESKERLDPIPMPLLTFKEAFPIHADSSNLRTLQQQSNPAINVKAFQDREIPWIGLLSLIAAFALVVTGQKAVSKQAISPRIDLKKQILSDLHNAQDLLNQKSYDAFYTELSHLIRHYIEITYHVEADTRTTEEFLHEMHLHPIFPIETQNALTAFLENADRVKYGHLPTSHKDAEEALRLALDLIES